VINNTFAKIAIAFLLLADLSLGGYDFTGAAVSKNLSMADFAMQDLESSTDNPVLYADAPSSPAANPGTELAVYTKQAPSMKDLKKLKISDIQVNFPHYIFYQGNYLEWNDFTAKIPNNFEALWIERAAGWSWYATLPLGGWTRELLYVPIASPLSIYEIYPSWYVTRYNVGFVKPGYYYIWYYADTLGRHLNVFGTNIGYSNKVIIDVYSIPVPEPIPPSPKEECEKNALCHWANNHCYCTGLLPEDPEKEKCEQSQYCNWVNGQCLCTMPDPEKEKCEQNPDCDWVNGHCYCRGLNPPEPEPEPMPGPAPVPSPNPEKLNCEQNPSCHWANDRCYCMGVGAGNDLGGSGALEGSGHSMGLGSTSESS
jgi:hypothetical protein